MWMKIDDGLHAHRKTRAVTKTHQSKTRDAAPMGLWVLAGSWSAQNATEGWVPEDELDRWDDDWRSLTARLVKAGYWWPVERDGEAGYGFTDWHDYNDPADMASKAGTFGNHVRWHVNEKKVDPECQHCPTEPDRGDHRGDIAPESGGDRGAIGGDKDSAHDLGGDSALSQVNRGVSGGESGGDSPRISGAIALPVPDPNPSPNPAPLRVRADATDAPPRDDVTRLCDRLADRIEANGAKRPTITAKWRDAARLMLDNDGRTEAEVAGAIDWCQADEFWRANVLSMPKLREKYDQLLLQAKRGRPPATRQQETDDLFERAAQRMGVRP